MTEQRNTPEHQRNTLEYHPNTNVTPAEHPGTTEPYKTKNNCSDFKENLNLALIHLTLATQDGNIFYCWYYLFIYFSLFKVGLHEVKKFFN